MNKSIIGFEKYEIDDNGNVFNSTGKMKLNKNGNGYLFVFLYSNGKPHKKYVHRLVAEAFLENLDNKKTINHKNSIRYDNRLENLEWATNSENQKHAFECGNQNSEHCSRSVKCINNNKNYQSAHEAARDLNLHYQNILKVCHGLRKTSGGLKFVFI